MSIGILWRLNQEFLYLGDFGYYVFGQSKPAYVFSAFMMLANNILLIGFHILTGAKILNTLSDHTTCTAVFSVIAALMGIVMAVPRTLQHVSFMSMFSCKIQSIRAMARDTCSHEFCNSCLYGYCNPAVSYLCWH